MKNNKNNWRCQKYIKSVYFVYTGLSLSLFISTCIAFACSYKLFFSRLLNALKTGCKLDNALERELLSFLLLDFVFCFCFNFIIRECKLLQKVIAIACFLLTLWKEKWKVINWNNKSEEGGGWLNFKLHIALEISIRSALPFFLR